MDSPGIRPEYDPEVFRLPEIKKQNMDKDYNLMGKSPDAKSRPDTQERPGPPMRKVFKKHLSIIKSNIDDIADYQEEVN